jgi:hypothetical protein
MRDLVSNMHSTNSCDANLENPACFQWSAATPFQGSHIDVGLA